MNYKYLSIGLVLAVLIGGAVFWVNYQQSQTTFEEGKIKVVASFYPLHFFAEQIGGDKISAINITPPGAEPHEYEPTPRDIIAMQESQLLLLNGAGFEPWAEKIKQNINPQITLMVEVSEGLTKEGHEDGDHEDEHEDEDHHEDEENGHHHAIDPHIWLSPKMATQMADRISNALIQIDPENSVYYETNLATLKAKLDELDDLYRTGLNSCLKRDIVTSHEAFGYLAAEYNLNQVAIAGISTDEEPSPQRLAEITKFVKDNDVEYIFFESMVSPRLAQTLSRETGAKTLELHPIEGLSLQELSRGEDYFTKMRSNLENLTVALQCQ